MLQIRDVLRMLINVRSARAGKATVMEYGLYRDFSLPSRNNVKPETQQTLY
jgi:hypothetical protein